MDVDACRFFTLDEADRFIETDDVCDPRGIIDGVAVPVPARPRRRRDMTLTSTQVATCLKIFEKLPKGASARATAACRWPSSPRLCTRKPSKNYPEKSATVPLGST